MERTSVLHLVALRLELCCIVAKQVKLVTNEVEKVGKSC